MSISDVFSGRATGLLEVTIATLDFKNCHVKMQYNMKILAFGGVLLPLQPQILEACATPGRVDFTIHVCTMYR